VKVADVLPVPPPVIPSWVPELIVQSVRGQYELAVEAAYGAAARECGYFDEFGDDRVPPEFADALSRDDVLRANVADFVRDELADTTARFLPLTCDPRMESVWRELSKRRSSDKFFHPARAPAAATVQEQQDRAMLDLFHTALRCQQQRDKTTATRGEIEQQRNYYLTKANELRADARVMHGLSFDMRPLALGAAARVYEEYASEFCPTSSEMVFERDDRARWVALTLVNKFRELFDQPMYGLTSTIASVVLNRRITRSTVRALVCS
jgi:hypothetical protein